MDLGLKGKVALVSGGASGIGEFIVRTLIEEGCLVGIIGRSIEKGNKLTHEIDPTGTQTLFISAELTQDAECKKAVDATIAKFGKLDLLVNNAGLNDGASLEKSPSAFMDSIQKNLFHYFALTHYSLEQIKKNQGSILNIASKTAVTGQGGTSGYAASNAAQLGLTREWAVDLLPYEVRVNAIVPAEVATPQYDSWIQTLKNPEETLKKITDKIPFGKRMTTSQEIADMAVFLLSKRASHITGQWIFVDGGYTHLDRSI